MTKEGEGAKVKVVIKDALVAMAPLLLVLWPP